MIPLARSASGYLISNIHILPKTILVATRRQNLMITFFADPYKGELINHTIARNIQYDGRATRIVLNELFDTMNKVSRVLSLGNKIGNLAMNLGNKYTSEYIIENFTVLPYYRMFCTQCKYEEIHKFISEKYSNNSSSLINVSSTLKEEIVYCPECIEEDINKYGEPYLHREHYLCGADVCYKHKEPLLMYDTIENIFKITVGHLELPSFAKLQNKNHVYKICNKQTALAVAILDANIEIYRDDLTKIYLDRLEELGILEKENIKYEEINKRILAIYGNVGKQMLKPYINPRDIKKHLFLNTENFIEPSIHLMFINMIMEDIDFFLEKCKQQSLKRAAGYKVIINNKLLIQKKTSKVIRQDKTSKIIRHNKAGYVIEIEGTAKRYLDIIEKTMVGPWKCKDNLCNANITHSKITYNVCYRQLRQEIKCECGCRYVVSKGVEEEYDKSRVKIIDYSIQTKKEIINYYVNLKWGYRRIGEKMGVSTDYVKKCLKENDITPHKCMPYKMLNLQTEISEEEVLRYFWEEWCSVHIQSIGIEEINYLEVLARAYKEECNSHILPYKLIIDKHQEIVERCKEIVRKNRSINYISREENIKLIHALEYLKLYALNELHKIIKRDANLIDKKEISSFMIGVQERLNEGEDISRRQLWNENRKAMKFLKENQPEWLDQYIPLKKGRADNLNVERKNETKEENSYQKKDKEYALMIESVSKELKEMKPPVRVTKTLIQKKIRGLKVVWLNEVRYPKAMSILKQVCESKDEYKIRVGI